MKSDLGKQQGINIKQGLGSLSGKFSRNNVHSDRIRSNLENEAKKIENEGKKQDNDMRREYAERIYFFASLYMLGLFMILFLSGSPSSFKMSDSVLITLLGTTTANVLGILIIVAKYLFPKK